MAQGSIPKTMRALVAYSQTDYRFEEAYPTPECGPDDIIIKTEACGICAGDLKCKHGAGKFWGDETQPSWVKPPFIPHSRSTGTPRPFFHVKERRLGAPRSVYANKKARLIVQPRLWL